MKKIAKKTSSKRRWITINIHEKTVEKLYNLKTFPETWDDVINKLLNVYKLHLLHCSNDTPEVGILREKKSERKEMNKDD